MRKPLTTIFKSPQKNYKEKHVCYTPHQKYYAITYKKDLIQLKYEDFLEDKPSRVKPLIFVKPYKAIKNKNELNKEFRTSDFEVYEVTLSKKIE